MRDHVTLAECEAALEHINAAPRDGAVIEQLCFRTGYAERSFPEQLDLSAEHGIIGERWAYDAWLKLPDGRPDPRIQVSIFSQRVVDLCWRNRLETPHPGDPIVVDMNLSVENMPVGQQLRAGSAIVEVSDVFNTACVKWQQRYGGASLRWINLAENKPYRLRGILCKIVRDGRVQLGDRLEKI